MRHHRIIKHVIYTVTFAVQRFNLTQLTYIKNTKLLNTNLRNVYNYYRGRDTAVGIATAYGLNDREVGVRILVGSRIFTSSYRPDRLWDPPHHLYNGYWGLFPGSKAAGA
jgi:hypothetical protein